MHENNWIAAGCCGSFVFNGTVLSYFFLPRHASLFFRHAESRQVIPALSSI